MDTAGREQPTGSPLNSVGASNAIGAACEDPAGVPMSEAHEKEALAISEARVKEALAKVDSHGWKVTFRSFARTACRGTSLIRNCHTPGPYTRTMPRDIW